MGIRLIKLADRIIGVPFCIFLGLLNLFRKNTLQNALHKVQRGKIKSILIIQLWGIGETILTIPAIKALKKRYRQTAVDVLCTARNKDVYFNAPFIRRLKVIRLNPFSFWLFVLKNRRRYDLTIDMEEYLNSSAIAAFFTGKYSVGYSHGARSLAYSKKVHYNDKQHASQTFFDLVKSLGVRGTARKLERLNYTGNDKKMVDSALKEIGIEGMRGDREGGTIGGEEIRGGTIGGEEIRGGTIGGEEIRGGTIGGEEIRGDIRESTQGKNQIVGIGAGAAESSKSRMWCQKNFAELIEGIFRKKKNCMVILVGASSERKLNEEIIRLIRDRKAAKNTFNFAGRLTLNQTFYLVSRCSLFVGNDSGPVHIAAAMNVKTIGLFGPNLPLRFSPLNKKSISIYKKMECSPCINVHKGQVPECLYPEASSDYRKCMRAIKVKDVLRYV